MPSVGARVTFHSLLVPIGTPEPVQACLLHCAYRTSWSAHWRTTRPLKPDIAGGNMATLKPWQLEPGFS